MWIGIILGALAFVVVVGAIFAFKGNSSGGLSEKAIAELAGRKTPELVSVLACRKAVITLSQSEDAPLRVLADQAVRRVVDQVAVLDDLRSERARTERRVGILANSTSQTSQVAGQSGLAASDVSAHSLAAEFENTKAREEIAAESLKATATAVAALQAAAQAMPGEGKPSEDQVLALQTAADDLAARLVG